MNLQASVTIPRRPKDGIDGDTGKGISEVKDFYGLSSSETSEPTEWFSYIPNKPADKYLWNYEKIIYTDGTSTDTKKRVIQGKDARSIESVVNAYAYSASDTVSPTSGWMSTIESLGVKPIGYFLWVRDDITYTDGTSSSTAGYVVKDGKDGEPGENGLPGQIPVRKEWVAGDTHRNNDTVIDYLYVRGATKGLSYWYKPLSTINDAQAPPKGGVSRVGYKRIDSSDELAVDVLLAEEANVAGFIFKGGQLISVRGTVGGEAADYSGQDGFVPNLILDGKEGNVKILGEVLATSGTLGDLIIEKSGRITMVDPATGVIRLMFSVANLPLIADLVKGVNSSGFANFGSGRTSTSQILSGNTQITKDGVTVTCSSTGVISIDAAGKKQSNGNVSTARAVVYLRKDGVRQVMLASTPHLIFSEEEYEEKIAFSEIQTFSFTGDAGLWDAQLVVESVGDIIPQSNSTFGMVAEIRLDWVHVVAGVKRQQYGLDGMMFFYSNHHFHFTEGKGLDLRGQTNMPGVLASGTVNTNGGLMNEWGAKVNYGQTITGGYRIFLKNMTHNKYSVQVTPHTNVTFRVSTKTSTYFDILGTGAADFVVFGSNY